MMITKQKWLYDIGIEVKIAFAIISLLIVTFAVLFYPTKTIVLNKSVRKTVDNETVVIQLVQQYNVFGQHIQTTNKIK